MLSQEIVKWSCDSAEGVPLSTLITGLRVGDIRNNASGKGKNVPVAWNNVKGNNVKLVLQTPKMYAPFGISEFRNPQRPEEKPSYKLPLAFKGETERMKAFMELMKAVDEWCVQTAYENQTAWFGETGKSRDIIEDRYNRHVTQKNPRYEPKISPKMDFRNDTFQGFIFNNDVPPVQVPPSYVSNGDSVIALIEFGSFWIADKSFGQHLKVVQIKTFKVQSIMSHAIVDEDGDSPMIDSNCIDDEAEADETYESY